MSGDGSGTTSMPNQRSKLPTAANRADDEAADHQERDIAQTDFRHRGELKLRRLCHSCSRVLRSASPLKYFVKAAANNFSLGCTCANKVMEE